ncbi:MAG TPA: fumarate hydratase [Methanomassiliicoccaceae archaeon]|nr:fumarate hydratase [Euryarchaeota archaeon]HOB38515.1 fumarate hydratase [Methanomassiliicoccaceae archaeon]HOK27900.1 fumarate hydratase [Methanomassiliicoccaceae archaeon]HOL07250.1 fumarate hydratase [Methanomassiliicoccaceae archaeon]HOQ25755.1 fumarate hydratase [Methanomassiliicoccaceae archaeon]
MVGNLIEEVVVQLLRDAVTTLPPDVVQALRRAESRETSEVARSQLRTILDNIDAADRLAVPMCQDTGVHVFYVTGPVDASVEESIRSGVARATEEIPLRPNAVHPLTRENPGTNVAVGLPHIVHYPTDDEFLEITVLPKGAGSENMTALAMLSPADGISGVKRFILDTVVRAGGRPCPPTIVGVGIGGTSDLAVSLAKEALLRPLDLPNIDPELAALEDQLTEALNLTGIGPMGLGGDTTVLGVRVSTAYCHTASLPVAVNLQCWAARRATARIYPDGRVRFGRSPFDP